MDEYLNKQKKSYFETHRNITESINKAANEALGNEEARINNKPWLTGDVEDLVKLRKEKYVKWLNAKDQNDKRKYDEIRRQVGKTISFRKNEMWGNKYREIDSYIRRRKCSESWKLIKSVKNTSREKAPIQITPLQKWFEHYRVLLTEKRPAYMKDGILIIIQGEQVDIGENDVIAAVKKSSKIGSPAVLKAFMRNCLKTEHQSLKVAYVYI